MNLTKVVSLDVTAVFKAIVLSMAVSVTPVQAISNVPVTSDDVSISQSCHIIIPADIQTWRELAQGNSAVSAKVKHLVFSYGWAGPSEQDISQSITTAKLGGDYFGVIANTHLPLSAGTWEFATLSDDGIRRTVDGHVMIDNWTWHGPTRDTGTFELQTDKTVEIIVEHFQIDGYAVLELKISSRH